MTPFIPCGVLYVLFSPFNRAKWVVTIATVAMVSFYQYKEQIQTCKRYLTYAKYVKLAAGIVLTNFMFALLMKTIITS